MPRRSRCCWSSFTRAAITKVLLTGWFNRNIFFLSILEAERASLVAQLVKNLPAMRETWVRSLGWEDLLEKGTATHSSILAWRIPWTIQSMGSQRVYTTERLSLQRLRSPRSSCHQIWCQMRTCFLVHRLRTLLTRKVT